MGMEKGGTVFSMTTVQVFDEAKQRALLTAA
jgi:hypothetical protein